MQKVSRFFGLVGLMTVALACSEPEPERVETAAGPEPPPLGAWIMYGGDQGMLKPGAFDEEETTLVLADSTYSLTFKRPDAQFVFVESGKVYYDRRARIARFTVASTSGMDWSSGTPRKLVLIPETVPFQRDPGTIYGLEWTRTDSLLSLGAEGQETSWFIRAPF